MKNIKRKISIALLLIIVIFSENTSLAFGGNEIRPMVEITPKLDVYSRQYFKIGNTNNESQATFDIQGWVVLHKSGTYTYVYDYFLDTRIISSNFTSFDAIVLGINLVDAKNNVYECTVKVRYGYKLQNIETVKYRVYI